MNAINLLRSAKNSPPRPLSRRLLWTAFPAQIALLPLVFGTAAAQDAAPVVNEFMASNSVTLYDEDGDASDWIELHNPTGQAVDLTGWALTDNEDEPDKWVFPGKTLDAGEYFVVFASGKDRSPGAGVWNSVVRRGDLFRYFPGTEQPPTDWNEPEFDASAWDEGASALGYERDGAGADIQTEVDIADLLSLYARIEFTVDNPDDVLQAVLHMDYDDGFVAYLNGQEIARSFMSPGVPSFDTPASGMHEAMIYQGGEPEPFAISNPQNLLRAGANVLAVEVHNANATSSDLTLIPFLSLQTEMQPAAYRGTAPEITFASRTEFHTNFRLSRGGEYLGLIDPSGQPVSEFAPEYPEQRPDVSYGLIDGGYTWFDLPTPGGPNVPGISDVLEAPTFSAAGSILDEPFSLYLFPETPGSIVRYTLDNSDPSEENGTPYTGPLYIDETTVVRATAFMEGLKPSSSVTRTYVFPEDVILQSRGNMVAKGWPAYWGGNDVDMGMDPDVVEGQEDDVIAALTAAPSFSIVLPLDSLFDTARGIYSNALNYGRDWERPASIELIYPPDFPPETGPRARHGGRDGFAVNAGVRIRGGWSRNDGNPKHAFRLYFRGEYGPSTLSYALFGDEGVDEFDKFDLRTAQNYSWSFYGSTANTMVREVFSRDTQRDMGVPYTRSRYYHLYLNGQYWGVFQTQERSDHWHGASYLGGNPDDYDVIKSAGLDGGYTVEVTAGVFDDWRFLYDEANRLAALPTEEERDALYMKLQGLNPDGSRNPDYPVLLDADNLIQYMLIIFWTGNTDSPITPFNATNNFFGVRERGGARGFTWFAHDSEHSLFSNSQFGDGYNRTGPFPTGDQFQVSNPQWLHQQLMGSNEYRLRFADLAQRHLSGNGTLTGPEAINRWTSRTDEVGPIILAESARWGDSKREPPLTPADWLREVTSVQNGFLPTRTPVILEQLRNTYRYEFGSPLNALIEAPLYPAVDAPVFSHPEGESPDSFTLTMQTPSGGTVFYTLDSADPRMPGGDVSGSAMAYDGTGIALSGYNRIRARVRSDDGVWSALEEAEYFAGIASPVSSRLVISEIHYNPTEPTDAEIAAGFDNNDDFEFIELHNLSSAPVALGGLAFTDGIAFAFGDEMLAPGARIVVAASENAFRMRYGPGANVAGSYASGRLNNGGEALTLSNAAGERLIHVEYNDGDAWPARADGGGSSLTLDPAAADDIDRAGAWRASIEYGGSPGASGRASFRDVIINELLAHSDPPQVDAIELHNPTSRSIDIGGWLLSDGAPLDKYRIPDGTTIEASGYVVFDENDFNAPGAGSGFALSSAYGDEVRLTAADASGNPALFADEVAFGATRTGETIGLPPGSVDAFVPLQEPTLGGPNSASRPAQVVFREIMYHPPGNNPNLEYVALYNAGDGPENLTGWTLRKGVDFTFPDGLQLAAGDSLFVVAFDPALQAENEATLRVAYGWEDDGRRLIGGWEGRLANEGETIELNRPDDPPADDPSFVPEILEERVTWTDTAPWPESADGGGVALYRTNVAGLGSDPAHWGTVMRTLAVHPVERLPDPPELYGRTFDLSAAYPNPTQGMARTHLTIARTQHVRATLYDMLGREVRSILNGTVASETIETLVVNGGALASGVYILRIVAEDFSAMRTFTVVR